MIDPVTLSALASSFATGAASAIGAEMGKDVYRAVSRGKSYCLWGDHVNLLDLCGEEPSIRLPISDEAPKVLRLETWY